MSSVLEASPPAARAAALSRSWFYVGMSATFLLIVLVGFTPTLYFRALFDVPQITSLYWIHGSVMTAWYVGALVQASLIAGNARAKHMQLGWALLVVAVGVLVTGSMVDFAFAERRLAEGVPAGVITRVAWSDRAALLSFAVCFASAVLLRNRRDVHKRLMLLASISVLQPATSRMWRWPLFEDINVPPAFLGISVLTALIVAIAVNDLRTNKQVHPATLAGGAFLLGSKLLFVFVLATTQFGIASVVR